MSKYKNPLFEVSGASHYLSSEISERYQAKRITDTEFEIFDKKNDDKHLVIIGGASPGGGDVSLDDNGNVWIDEKVVIQSEKNYQGVFAFSGEDGYVLREQGKEDQVVQRGDNTLKVSLSDRKGFILVDGKETPVFKPLYEFKIIVKDMSSGFGKAARIEIREPGSEKDFSTYFGVFTEGMKNQKKDKSFRFMQRADDGQLYSTANFSKSLSSTSKSISIEMMPVKSAVALRHLNNQLKSIRNLEFKAGARGKSEVQESLKRQIDVFTKKSTRVINCSTSEEGLKFLMKREEKEIDRSNHP